MGAFRKIRQHTPFISSLHKNLNWANGITDQWSKGRGMAIRSMRFQIYAVHADGAHICGSIRINGHVNSLMRMYPHSACPKCIKLVQIGAKPGRKLSDFFTSICALANIGAWPTG